MPVAHLLTNVKTVPTVGVVSTKQKGCLLDPVLLSRTYL